MEKDAEIAKAKYWQSFAEATQKSEKAIYEAKIRYLLADRAQKPVSVIEAFENTIEILKSENERQEETIRLKNVEICNLKHENESQKVAILQKNVQIKAYKLKIEPMSKELHEAKEGCRLSALAIDHASRATSSQSID